MKAAAPLTVLALALVLGACGFHPLYAVPGQPRGAMQRHMQAIYVAAAPERVGYELRNQLIDLLDGSADTRGASYRLSFTIQKTQEAIGVQSQQVGSLKQTTITRYNDRLVVDYELSDIHTGAVLTKGTEIGLSSYNVLASPYATLAAEQDADRHSAADIADRVRIALAAYFAQKK